MKALFGSSRRSLVCSDSTIQRLLPQLDQREMDTLLFNSMNEGCDHQLLMCQLDTHTQRSIGIVDGSKLFKQYYFTMLTCTGEQGTFTQAIQPMKGSGHELASAEELLIRQATYLPQLVCGDGLYLCERMMHLVCNKLDRNLLVKYPDKKRDGTSRRKEQEIIEHARRCMDKHEAYRDAIQTAKGYDSERMTSYYIEAIADTYSGVPVTVLRVTEEPKRLKPTRFWIVTSDTGLSLTAAREAAHQEKQIENNGFKRLSALAGTKKMRTHNRDMALRLLCCIAAGVNLLTAIINEIKYVDAPGLPRPDKRTWETVCNWLANVITLVTRRGCNVLNVG